MGANKMRKLLQILPFWHHQPPMNLPMRRLVIMAMNRPVSIPEMEARILSHLKSRGNEIIPELESAIIYLRNRRFHRRDAANLFIASIRATCNFNPNKGIDFGLKFIKEMPDNRAIRSLVTYLNRLERPDESLELLDLCSSNDWEKEMRGILNLKVHGPPPDDDGSSSKYSIPWLFQQEEEISLSNNLLFLQHPFSEHQIRTKSGFNSRFELIGTLNINENELSTAALVNFLFFDKNGDEVRGVEPGGLIRSRTVGWYSYLNHDSTTGEFCVEFEPPNGTARVMVGFRLWKSEGEISINPGIEIRTSSLDEFYRDLDRFQSDVIRSNAEQVVFMFSGTTFVQELRANRPIRLTRELLSRNIPVLFNYHRWKRTDEWPPYQGDLLLQIPIDVTKTILGEIAEMDFGNIEKTFIISYPHPSISKILNRFRLLGWKTIYDARDEWEEFEKVGQAKWYRTYNEKYIVHNSDHVTAVSKPLADKLDDFSPREPVEVVPNALSPHFLSSGYKWKGDSKVIAGYFGHLTASWFDWDSLIEIALLRPKYHFEIIGHSAPEDLDLPDNIDLMGPRNHAEINEIASRWSVAIIPFIIGPLADGVDPIKIYEYMALDLPTVSFRMPQIDSYPYTITVENITDFCSALDEFSRFRPRKDKLKNWLKTNTWGDRVDRFLYLSQSTPEDGIYNLGVMK